jgi:hypothetical protein
LLSSFDNAIAAPYISSALSSASSGSKFMISLPDRAMITFLPLTLKAPFCYAWERNIVARWGIAGLDALNY